MSDPYVNLHAHSSYSQLDGASKIPGLVQRHKELGAPAVCISDHGNLNGIVELYKECKSQDVKPILGQEFYFTDDRLLKESVKQENESGIIDGSDKRYYHLTVLAQNNDGYHNLLKLSSDAFINGMWYKPRSDYSMLERHSEGLIVGTGCLGGPVLQPLLHENYDAALNTAARLQDIVGKGNMFVELMDHGLPEQRKTNPYLIDIARKLDAPIIATMDSHYTHKHDAASHGVLLCCQTGSKLSDPTRFHFHNDEYYVKSPEEMRHIFRENIDAIDNTLLIAERVDVEIDFDTLHLPKFPVPEGYVDDYDFLETLVSKGLEAKYNDIPTEYAERAAYELSVIKALNLSSYFLIFWDLVNFTQREGILTGPGRGSAAGSLVSYILGITKLDPIEHNLIFERFINPSRIALADVDWDTDTRYREILINYTKEKYGEDHVAQIITFGTIKARTAVRDAARVMGHDYMVGDKISKLMPPLIMGFDTPLKACLDFDEKYESGYKNAQGLRDLYNIDPIAREIIDAAIGLEGLVRQHGVHAAAVVIGDQPLDNIVPLQKDKNGNIITQWEKNTIEDLGLLKMDFLGLRNLDIISDTLKMLGYEFSFLENLDMHDPKTFQLLQQGSGIGVFQVESPQMRELLKRLVPTSIDDIAAVLALYRPGPMAMNMHYDYADRKNKRQLIKYFHEDAKPILGNTYGLAVYQEQVMEISKVFAGYSMAEADNLRKIMGKKLPEAMAKEKTKFVSGCVEQGYEPDFSSELFHMIEGFAAYGFNASHAYSYAYISYWTAYLKAHHPKEYFASICTSVMDEIDRSAVYLNEAKRIGLKVYPPDLNLSEMTYTVESDGIRIGLGAMKNFGESQATKLIEERSYGKFTNLYDFTKRYNPNINALKSLAYSGALDSFGTRQGIDAIAEDVLKATRKESKKNIEGQGSMFDSETAIEFEIPTTEFKEADILRHEKETLGVYVSGHPLDELTNSMTKYTLDDVKSLDDQKELVKCLVMISDVKVKYTKKGDAMATLTIEDQTGTIELVCFPKKWDELKHEILQKGIAYVSFRIGRDFRDERNFILQKVENIHQEEKHVDEQIFGIYLPKKFHLDVNYMSKLKGIVLSHAGKSPLRLYTSRSSMLKLKNEYYVDPTVNLKIEIKELFDKYAKSKKKGK
jgi:DNA polymerase-3 subunit alpha